jgi:hypothetical protein
MMEQLDYNLLFQPLRFISATFVAASPVTSSVFSHGRGPSSFEENTTLGVFASPAIDSFSSAPNSSCGALAKPCISL